MAALDWNAMTRKYGRDVPVLGSTMSVVDVGPLDPATSPVLVFLHGNPTSSFLWRKVIAALAPRFRCVAIDLIGMGRSGKPDIDYSWADHRAYLTEALDRLDVGTQPVRLVTHDWGVGLGIEYARTHRLRVAGVAFAEGHLRPLPSWEAFDDGGRELFRRLRDPVDGRREVLDDDVFLSTILPGGMHHRLTTEEMRAYREPFPTPASRLPIWAWVSQIPVGGDPAPVHDALSANYEWLARTSTPRLLLHAHPGAIITPTVAAELGATIPDIASVDVGRGLHFLPEDQPEGIAAALAAWASATATIEEGVRGAARQALRTNPLSSRPRCTEDAGMSETEETGDVTVNVVDRLAARFPTLARDHIAEVVDEEHERLNGARVRDFIPLLVEHEATERLRLEADPQQTVGEPLQEKGPDGEPGVDPMEQQRRTQPPSGPLLGNYGRG